MHLPRSSLPDLPCWNLGMRDHGWHPFRRHYDSYMHTHPPPVPLDPFRPLHCRLSSTSSAAAAGALLTHSPRTAPLEIQCCLLLLRLLFFFSCPLFSPALFSTSLSPRLSTLTSPPYPLTESSPRTGLASEPRQLHDKGSWEGPTEIRI